MARSDAALLLTSGRRLASALAEAIEARRDLDMAIGVITATAGADRSDAELILRRTAQEGGVSLRVAARQIIDARR